MLITKELDTSSSNLEHPHLESLFFVKRKVRLLKPVYLSGKKKHNCEVAQ
jgi:hypothetical protein